MKPIQPWQIKVMYAVSRSIGMDSDALHTMVMGLTEKESIKTLTEEQAACVIAELKKRQQPTAIAPPAKSKNKGSITKPGGVTAEQQSKVWALIGELEKLDAVPKKGNYRIRLCGIIKKEFGMDAAANNPFHWLDMKDGIRLIDTLKRYVAQEKKKAARKGSAAYG